jgi:DNA-binding NtrC family response regulator
MAESPPRGDEPTRSATLPSGPVRLSSGVVRVLDGPDRGLSRALSAAPLVVGGGEGAELRLSDPRVSRRHCELRLGPFGFLVRDLDSRNGTLFEGSRVGELAVPPGAILRVGHTHIALAAAGDAAGLPPSQQARFGALVGPGLAMRRTFALLERAAACDASVLLGGETGTGKELAARAIHTEGRRAAGPFEVLDCGAIPAGLLASELFGHVRGAFTGAREDRAGIFERAHHGTVFLDEIGELPLELQPALLRACDRGEVTPAGGNLTRKVDVRVVAATHRDLAAEVLARRFREDLYYRLQVLPITLPPLRARKDDLPALCAHFLADLGLREPGPITGENLALLASHGWPGNVRELRNTLAQALSLSAPGARFTDLAIQLGPATASPEDDPSAPFSARKDAAIARFERDFLTDLMRQHDGNIKAASRGSGIERTQLKRMLRKHGLI